MKRHALLYICLLLIVAVSDVMHVKAQQQSKQYALYNYRNDGNFNAWLNIDVDSITYSRIDTLGVEHEDVVVQEVWTPDSVYRIPLEAIDSIGFREPEPVMSENLFYLRDYHASHTIAIDSLTLFFDHSIHRDSLPAIGQVLVTANNNTSYEEGFAGVVDYVENISEGVKVTCHHAEISDIFKKLILVGKVVGDYGGGETNMSRKKVEMGQFYDKIPLPDINLSLFKGILTIKSKNPYLNCNYFVYIDELMYNISADVNIKQPELSFQIAFKLSDLKGIATPAADALVNLIEGSELKTNRQVLEECLTQGIPIPLVKTGVFNLTLKLSPMIKLSGDIELDLLTKTSVYQHIGFHAVGYSKLAQFLNLVDPTIPVGEINNSIRSKSFSSEMDPMKVEELKAKVKGNIAQGIIVQLEANLVSKQVVHASIGAEWGTQLAGTLQFNLYDSSTEELDKNFYDLIKDSRIEIKDYAKIKGEIGASPCSYLSMGNEASIYTKVLGDYYAVPHFSEPSLPKYQNGSWLNQDPLSFYSTVSKDVLLSCKPGMIIVDMEGLPVKEIKGDESYQYEVAWRTKPISINASNLNIGKKYRCYPTFSILGSKYFKAGPYCEFTVPKKVSASPDSFSLPIDGTQIVEILNGWDTFAAEISGNDGAAAIVNDNDTDARHIKVKGLKKGNLELQIEDRRTGELIKVPFTVTSDAVTQSMIKVEPTEIDFGQVPVGISRTRYFTVSNVGASNLTFSVTEPAKEFRIPDAGKEFTLSPSDEKKFAVTFSSSQENHSVSSVVRIFSDAENGTQYLKLKGQTYNSAYDAAILVEPMGINFGAVPKGTIKESYFTVTNIGQADLRFTINQPSAPFTIIGAGTEDTLTPGQPKQFTVTCDGSQLTSSGIQTHVNITSNATNVDWGFGLTLKATGETQDNPPVAYFTCPDGNHPHAIDLGLPSGTLWACCNVGATNPEAYGGYFAWGEIEEKGAYTWNNYTHYEEWIGADIAGLQYDVATSKWGRHWRMPTSTQIQELIDNCFSEWITYNGVNGRKFTSPNGAEFFMPAAGYKIEFEDKEFSETKYQGISGSTWSSTQSSDWEAYFMTFSENGPRLFQGDYKSCGRPVRPVSLKAERNK